MRKKTCYSEENFLSANSSKLSESLRQNPRLPIKKMKSAKTKYVNPTVRTVGQWSCGGGKSAYSSNPFGLQNVSGGELETQEADEDLPMNRLHRTFSNNHTLKSFKNSSVGDYSVRTNTHFGIVKDEPQTRCTPPTRDMATTEQCASVKHKTSEMGVQVNMFHCKECRRHIKYGKIFKLETSCTESDSETNMLASNVCTTCESEERLLQHHTTPCNSCDCSPRCEHKSPSPRPGGDATPRDNDCGSEMIFSQIKGGEQIWLLNIKFMTVALLTISSMLYFMQTPIVGATISKIYFYISNIIRPEETEEEDSVFSWVLDYIFGLHGNPIRRTLFL